MKKALIVGGFGVDLNVALYEGAWPLSEGDGTFAQVGELSLGHAGSGVALQCAALGLYVAAADVLGDDDFGWVVRKELARRGVRLEAVTHESGTRRSVVLVRPDGGRFFLHDPRHPYDMTVGPMLWLPGMEDADWVHIVIVNWARHALRDARERGILTSTDLQDWDTQNEHHREFAYGADVVFCSATALPDADVFATDVFTNGIARLVIVTKGADGAVAYQRDAEPIYLPALLPPGRTIVDTTGAGDAFCGAFMSGLVRGQSIPQAGRRAALAAAYAASFTGTNSHLITVEELDQVDAKV